MTGGESGVHQVPPLGSEVLKSILPGLAPFVEQVCERLWADPSWADTQVVPPPDHPTDSRQIEDLRAKIVEYVEGHATYLFEVRGSPPQAAIGDANLVGHHLQHILNFELHHRKTFWVDESLAWMLRMTRIDVDGRSLKLPFPAFAVVFTDRSTHLDRRHHPLRGHPRSHAGRTRTGSSARRVLRHHRRGRHRLAFPRPAQDYRGAVPPPPEPQAVPRASQQRLVPR